MRLQRMVSRIAQALICLLISVSVILAQQISGTIAGVVKDSQQATVSNAKLTLDNNEQGTTRSAITSAWGSLVFTELQPGSYSLTVEAPGFKKFEQKDINVFANDRVGLPDIVLSVGAVSETVIVEAEAAAVQTTSAERSGVLTSRQVLDLAETGRSLFDLTKTLPGIVYTGGLGGVAANGNRHNQDNFDLDASTNG